MCCEGCCCNSLFWRWWRSGWRFLQRRRRVMDRVGLCFWGGRRQFCWFDLSCPKERLSKMWWAFQFRENEWNSFIQIHSLSLIKARLFKINPAFPSLRMNHYQSMFLGCTTIKFERKCVSVCFSFMWHTLCVARPRKQKTCLAPKNTSFILFAKWRMIILTCVNHFILSVNTGTNLEEMYHQLSRTNSKNRRCKTNHRGCW